MALKNDRLIRALNRQPVDKTPIWLMRQAGRYLPEYMALRAKVPDFMTFCKTPELAHEVTMQPLARFPLDAAIVFSDILTIPDAMGMDLAFVSGKGPVFASPIRSEKDLKALKPVDVPVDLAYVTDTIQHVVRDLDGQVPLIGFSGSPWTVATYMIEGGGSKTFEFSKRMLYENPVLLHQLLTRITESTIHYLNAQIEAGAQAIMIFDTWGGVLSQTAYQQFSLSYMSKIVSQLNRVVDGQRVPVVFFTKQADPWLELIAQSGCDGIGLDSSIDLHRARQRVGHDVALQGNLDPFLLFSKPLEIQQAVIDILDAFDGAPGHVFNLGHGIHKETPIENVSVLVDAVHQYGLRGV